MGFRKALIILALFCSPLAHAAVQDTIKTTVCFQDSQGNCLANGLITLDLSQSAMVTSGGGLVAPIHIAIQLTAAGLIPNGTLLWGNDQLTPSGTTYLLQLFNSNGLFVASFGRQSIQGPSPIDFSLLTPVTTSNGTVSYPNPCILNTNCPSISGPNTFTGANTFNATLSYTNLGVFTNTQDNQPFTSNLNGFSWSAADPFFLTDAFASAVEVPASSAVTQSDGVSGGCETQSTATNCVGLFGIGLARVNGGNAWGINTITNDKDSLGVPHTGAKITGYEADLGCHDATTICFGVFIVGAVGNVTPTTGGAVRIGKLANFSASAQWPYAFGTDPAATPIFALVNPICLTGTCNSATIIMNGFNSSVSKSFSMFADTNGSMNIIPQSGAAALIAQGAIVAEGSQTVSGCSLTGAIGGAWAGAFASGVGGVCTVTITPGITAPHGFACVASDIGTPADTVKQTAYTQTNCTISGTTVNGDPITWTAIAF